MGHNTAEHGITQKLERLVVQFAGFEIVSGCDLLVRP
jgi:hypothetical protein